jgi:cyclophilin family peptidyl-prolyl cis-trans isomerase
LKRLAVCLALLAAGCGGGEKTVRDKYGCEQLGSVPRKHEPALSRPTESLDPAKTYVATVDTSCGTFAITLDAKRAPKTGGSFKYLADHRFYDGVIFHRIIPGFVIQGGDPKGTGQGGPGYQVVEPPPKTLRYTPGTVAMAKTPADKRGASGSQFFVVTGAAAATLRPDFALLGRVTRGRGVVNRMGSIITDPNTDRPENPVVIRSIRVKAS